MIRPPRRDVKACMDTPPTPPTAYRVKWWFTAVTLVRGWFRMFGKKAVKDVFEEAERKE